MMNVKPGDIVITSITLARSAEARLEILNALPGRSAIGPLCLGRTVRGGAVPLVGPEHLSQLAFAIDFIQSDSLAKTILIDGAVGRITHLGALCGSQFLYCARADYASFRRVAENIELVSSLADLPLDVTDAEDDSNGKLHIDGPLTTSVLEKIQDETTRLCIGNFTDCFLDAAAFRRACQRFEITVQRRVPLLGFVVALKNISRNAFLEAVPSASRRVFFNPFELEAANVP